MKKIIISIISLFLFITGCMLPNNIKDKENLSENLEKHPMITNFYIDELNIDGIFILSKHDFDQKIPVINLNIKIKKDNTISIIAKANIVLKKIKIFELFYDIKKGKGFYINQKNEKKDLSKEIIDSVVIGFNSNDFLRYFNAIFLLFNDQWDILYEKKRYVDNDIIYSITDSLVNKVMSKSSIHNIEINYLNYSKFDKYLKYPKLIKINAMNKYEGKLMIKELNYSLNL